MRNKNIESEEKIHLLFVVEWFFSKNTIFIDDDKFGNDFYTFFNKHKLECKI